MKDQRSLSLEFTAQQGRRKMGRNTCHTGYEGLTVQYEGAETEERGHPDKVDCFRRLLGGGGPGAEP